MKLMKKWPCGIFPWFFVTNSERRTPTVLSHLAPIRKKSTVEFVPRHQTLTGRRNGPGHVVAGNLAEAVANS